MGYGHHMRRTNHGFTLVELMIVVAIIGILAALAIPNFIKFQARAKQSEAKTTLRGLSTAQTNYFAESDRYANNLSDVNFQVERGNRYAYFSALTPTAWQDRSGPTMVATADYQGVEVDTYRIAGATARPARAAGAAAFTVTYDGAASGPTDTGVIPGSSGGYIYEGRGTVDNDAAIDTWVVSSGSITVPLTACTDDNGAPGGIPTLIYNDVMCP